MESILFSTVYENNSFKIFTSKKLVTDAIALKKEIKKKLFRQGIVFSIE